MEDESTSLVNSNKITDDYGAHSSINNVVSDVDDYPDSFKGDVLEVDTSSSKLGTITGVFVPCILSIFGVILFERLGWVVGQAGILLALGIMFGGYLVVTLTTLSLSAIATNGKIKGGGAYYMISRSLGPAFGGSIGIIFYCANIAAGGTYMLGFIGIMIETIPADSKWNGYVPGIVYGTIALFFLFIICLVGASAYAKAAIFIFGALWISILSVIGSFIFEPKGTHKKDPVLEFTSWSSETFKGNVDPDFTGETFQSIFAVFFPAVTGIMAGANMSGDLANPGKSIPAGTLGAIGLTSVVYTALILIMGATVTRDGLINKFFIMNEVCFWSPIVFLGIVASSLSSALGALIGASRILQAFARDNLIPGLGWIGKGYGANDEPRIAVLITYVLIQFTCFLPVEGKGVGLNIMATMTTMFFLLSYGVVNFACFTQRIVGSPNFRPTFKYFNLWLSLFASLCCIGAMFYVNPIYAGVSVLLMLALILFIMWRSINTNWGDVSQAILYHQVRKYLLLLDSRKTHVKYWRPQILYLVKNPKNSVNVIEFLNNLKKGGLYMLGTAVEGDYSTHGTKVTQYHDAWVNFIASSNLKAFPEVVLAPTIRDGLQSLILLAGIGAMKPNTVVLGCYNTADETSVIRNSTSLSADVSNTFSAISRADENFSPDLVSSTTSYKLTATEYADVVRQSLYFDKNVLITRNFEAMDRDLIVAYRGSRILRRKQRMTIDMWPLVMGDEVHDASVTLTLLLGWILKQTDIWSNYSKMRVKGIALNSSLIEEETRKLQDLLDRARIYSRIEVCSLVESGCTSVNEAISNGMLQQDGTGFDRLTQHEKYLILNDVIRKNSDTTCAVFISMPAISSDRHTDAKYVASLQVLTENLPPVVCVNGISTVITEEI